MLASRLNSLGSEGALSILSSVQRCLERGIDVVRLNMGEPDFDAAPHITEAAVDALRAGNSHYVAPEGIPELRRAIAAYVSRTRDIPVQPDQVIVTPGAKLPIAYSVQTYVNPGDDVVFMSPSFPIFESMVQYFGANPVPVPLQEKNGFRLTADELAARVTKKTKLVFLCSPNNPTGSALTREQLGAIAEVIRTQAAPDARVYSDEIYEHIVFDGARHNSIATQPGMQERTIIVSGFSKGFAMTGWRLGFAVLPNAAEALMFRKLAINHTTCSPPFVQVAGVTALESPESEPAVRHMVETFERRRNWIVDAISRIDGVHCAKPDGAFYVFPNVAQACERLGIMHAYTTLDVDTRARTSPARMFQMFLLARHGVAANDRASFCFAGSEGQHFIRISFAASDEMLQEGVRRLAAAATDVEGYQNFYATDRAWATEGHR